VSSPNPQSKRRGDDKYQERDALRRWTEHGIDSARACAPPPRGPGGCWRRSADHAHRGHGRPGGGCDADSVTINDPGQIAGDYLAADGTTHGYLRDHGRIITVNGPAGAARATVFDINDLGQMVGLYYGSAGEFHAFSLRGGRYTSIDAPGVTYTLPFGVNNRGQIAGLTAAALPLTPASDAHGFVLRDGAGGPLTPVDVPGAVFGTEVFDIKNAGAVVVVGVYGLGVPDPPARLWLLGGLFVMRRRSGRYVPLR
jgi:hypothetical protein